MAAYRGYIEHALQLTIDIYRWFISPFLGPCCRFYPSCSSYAKTAIEKYGAFKGVLFTLKRISKCHPWHEGGVDFVP